MTNEELKKWIEFGSDETDMVCPCCGGTGQKKKGGSKGNPFDKIPFDVVDFY